MIYEHSLLRYFNYSHKIDTTDDEDVTELWLLVRALVQLAI